MKRGAPPAAGLRKGAPSSFLHFSHAASLRFEMKRGGCFFFFFSVAARSSHLKEGGKKKSRLASTPFLDLI